MYHSYHKCEACGVKETCSSSQGGMHVYYNAILYHGWRLRGFAGEENNMQARWLCRECYDATPQRGSNIREEMKGSE